MESNCLLKMLPRIYMFYIMRYCGFARPRFEISPVSLSHRAALRKIKLYSSRGRPLCLRLLKNYTTVMETE